MAEIDTSQQQQEEQQQKLEGQPQQQENPPVENISQNFEKLNIPSSFSIWPPTQRTRDAVIKRLIETLSQPSVLSKRYGSMPEDEASATAHSIEEEAFKAASATGGSAPDAAAASIDDGIEILQVYSKEISKRMLDAVKSRAPATVATPDVSSVQSPAAGGATTTATVTSEEVSSVDNESTT
ncbi:RNA polymerase III-inhibiting protein maf1 [Ancistrocladus abbreviatus]